MAWFFSGNSTAEVEEEQQSNPLYEDNDIFTVLDVLHTDNYFTIGKMDLPNFLRYIENWAFNRPLKPKRVRELKGEIKAAGGRSLGFYTVGKLGNRCYLVNGQHRRAALTELFEENQDFNTTLFIELYPVNSEEEIVQLFRKVNNTEPLDPRETPNIAVMDAVNALAKEYNIAIKNSGEKSVYYPHIAMKELSERIKPLIRETTTGTQIVTLVNKLNSRYSRMNINTIPNVRQPLLAKTVEKARKSRFYLGLDEQWSWLLDFEKEI